MQTLDALRRRIESAEELLSVVKTMKTMAAANINQYERAVASLDEFDRALRLAFQVAMRRQPDASSPADLAESPADGAWGVILCGSDQGLAGRFNEQVVDYLLDTMNGLQIPHGDRRVLVMGRRAAGRLDRAGQAAEATVATPGSVQAIVPTVQQILVHIAQWQSAQEMARLVIFSNRAAGRTTYAPQMVQLFPMDPDWLEQVRAASWPSRRLPVIFMPWQELVRGLNRQYLFMTLYRAVAESLAAEHAARLSSMQAAEQNIEEHLDEFNSAYQQQRQRVITDELLDIISGFEALTG